MRRWAAWALMSVALGCGGTQKPTENAVTEDDESETEEVSGEGDDEGFIAPEKYDEIESAFKRKRSAVVRCYEDAVEAGTLNKKAEGRIRVALTILADGSPRNVKVTEDTLKSDEVADCVVGLVASWQLPAPQAKMEFSFAYDFEPE